MFWLTRIRSHSMAPTLPDGSLALTRRLWRTSPVRRGDLVTLDSPERGIPMVKRAIGLPGETVVIKEGEVSIDGQALAEPYASRSVFHGHFQVPPGHYFLLGDNRDASSDSRTWQEPYIAREALLGRILEWPWTVAAGARRAATRRMAGPARDPAA